MNAHDVTGGSDLNFSEPVRFSAVNGANRKDITDRLRGKGFELANPPSDYVLEKQQGGISHIILQGEPSREGSYIGKVRSSGPISPEYIETLKKSVDGVLEPYNVN